jgi:hypothetical protein
LDVLLREYPRSGTNFASALQASQSVMLQHWTAERLVSLIRFLSVPIPINQPETDHPS